MYDYGVTVWVICTGIGMFGMSNDMEFLRYGWVKWELNVWDERGGWDMINMKFVCDRRNSMSLVGRSHGGV